MDCDGPHDTIVGPATGHAGELWPARQGGEHGHIEVSRLSTSPLHAIAYVSEVRRPWSLGEVDRLLVTASAINGRLSITGVLLYDGHRFFQYIEGAPANLYDTYNRIKRSSRHDLVAELYNDQITERYFPHWQMACRKVQPGSIVEVSGQRWNRARLALTVAGGKPKVIQHLLSFWEGSELVFPP